MSGGKAFAALYAAEHDGMSHATQQIRSAVSQWDWTSLLLNLNMT